MGILDDIDRLGKQEQDFQSKEFFAPYIRGSKVQIGLDGVTCDLSVRSMSDRWGVFRATSFRNAEFIRSSTLTERETYLNLFVQVRMVCLAYSSDDDGDNRRCLAYPFRDDRHGVSSPVHVLLPEPTPQFAMILARWDGRQFWFDRDAFDRHQDRLTESLRESIPVEGIRSPGLCPEHRHAYSICLASKEKRAAEEHAESYAASTEGRIQSALNHSQAEYIGFTELPDGFTVEYSVDGEVYQSTIDRDFQVRSAGICLDGTDSRFDLTSLVNVVRHAQDNDLIYRM